MALSEAATQSCVLKAPGRMASEASKTKQLPAVRQAKESPAQLSPDGSVVTGPSR